VKHIFVIAALTASLSAFAGNDVPGNCGNGSGSGNACLPSGGHGGNGGNGGNGGAGGSGGSVIGSGNSANSNQQVQNQGQFQGQGQSQSVANSGNSSATGGQSNAAGGAGGYANGGNGGAASANAAGGNGAGNQTSVSVAGATYEAAASTAYAPNSGAPRTSCRIFVGLGGASVNGSLSGGLPIGNDQTCLSGAQIEFMNNVNKVAPGTFGGADYLIAACAVEGMDKMAACKK
jgi:hypothetical protein